MTTMTTLDLRLMPVLLEVPVPGHQARALAPVKENFPMRWLLTSGPVHTNRAGSFEFRLLPDGSEASRRLPAPVASVSVAVTLVAL